MDVKELLEKWERSSGGVKMTVREYRTRLPIHDAARVAALAEMYPLNSEEDIIRELLSVALNAVEAAFPYEQGDKVIAEDEMGDPMYEDVGPTPRFLKLTKQQAERMEQELCGQK